MSARITDETLNAVISKIYAAACDQRQWPELLHAIARAIEGRGTLIFDHNFKTREAHIASDVAWFNVAVDWDPDYVKSYDEHYSRINNWSRNEPELKTGRAVTGAMLYPERQLPKTEFYNDWLRPQGYFHLLGGVIVRNEDWSTHFSSLRGRRQGDFSPEQVRFYQTLVPHLARAIMLRRRFAFLESVSSASLAVLDTIPAAIMLLDRSARVLHSNAAAEDELRRGDPLRLGFSGEISVRGSSRGQSAIRTAIGAALDPARSVKEGSSPVAQIFRRNGETLLVHAVSLRHGDLSRRAAGFGPGLLACALIVHGSAARVSKIGVHLLRNAYGLTPAEVQVAVALAEGEVLRRYAERRGISPNTARSQLKGAFNKIGIRRQSELVSCLLACGAAAQSESPS